MVAYEFIPEGGAEFDEQSYLDLNPDVATAVRNGLVENGYAHYLRGGWLEGRIRPTPSAREHSKETRVAQFSWSEPLGPSSATVSYTVRVVQTDGELAVSSPIWVRSV